MSGIPQQYQDQRNAVAAQSERDRLRWNEYAAATGLGSGVNGQASLAFSTQLQNDLAPCAGARQTPLRTCSSS